MRILLTGSTGFLGRILLKNLKNVNNVITLGRVNCDLSFDLNSIDLELPKVDLVIHAAGKAHQIPNSREDAEEYYRVNVQGTANLLKALDKRSLPKSFVFISTVAVYGLNKGNLINEETPLLARDPYGLSKIRAEILVQEWCKKNALICTILRLPLIAAPNPPGNLGAMVKGIQKGYYFNIDRGEARKSVVLAEDVAKFILNAAEVGGIYNLTDGYHPNFNELSELIAEQSGKAKVLNMPLVLARIAAKIGDLSGKCSPLNTEKLNKITATLTFNDSKARTAFGWKPTTVLKGLKIYT